MTRLHCRNECLTPEGRKLKRRLVPLAEEVNAIAMSDIPEADVGTARRLLLSIIENLAQDADDLHS